MLIVRHTASGRTSDQLKVGSSMTISVYALIIMFCGERRCVTSGGRWTLVNSCPKKSTSSFTNVHRPPEVTRRLSPQNIIISAYTLIEEQTFNWSNVLPWCRMTHVHDQHQITNGCGLKSRLNCVQYFSKSFRHFHRHILTTIFGEEWNAQNLGHV